MDLVGAVVDLGDLSPDRGRLGDLPAVRTRGAACADGSPAPTLDLVAIRPPGRQSQSTDKDEVAAIMATDVAVALGTSGAGLAVALASVSLSYVIARKVKREQTLDIMMRYRDPLLWSVHDLRSRIRTILDEDFLSRFLVISEDPILGDGDNFMRPYARRHTMFVLAEYLGWVEIVRRSVGFLDLGDRKRNRRLMELLSIVRRVLFALDLNSIFHVPIGQQRAIGELMIVSDSANEGRGWRCIGFAEFCARLDNDSSFSAWFERPERAIIEYAMQPSQGHNRLVELNLRLTDLIDFFDADGSRFPLRNEERARYLSSSDHG